MKYTIKNSSPVISSATWQNLGSLILSCEMLYPYMQSIRNVIERGKHDVSCKKPFRQSHAAYGGVVECTLEPLIGVGVGGSLVTCEHSLIFFVV